VKLLLDTHIVLWALSDDPRLTPEHRKALEGEARLMVSPVSIWEISVKRTLDRLLIAQSQCEDIPVITEDKAFSAYDLALYEGQGTS